MKIIKENLFNLKCDCGCGSEIQILNVGDNDVDIDVRDSSKSKWHGVYLEGRKKRKVTEFLKKIK